MNAQTKGKAETLAMAMAVAFGEIEAATKASENSGFKQGGKASKYADLTSVIEAIKPALVNNGLFFTQHPQPSEGGVCIETMLHHCGGESLSLGKLFVPADRSNAHGYGSALTYARRYALVTAFGVPVEDDDGNAASEPRPQTRAKEMPDHEWAKLVQLVEATSANIPAMLKHLSIVVADNNLRLLNQDQYARVVEALNTKLAAMAKAESDAKAKEAA